MKTMKTLKTPMLNIHENKILDQLAIQPGNRVLNTFILLVVFVSCLDTFLEV